MSDTISSDEFDKLLDDFISSQLQEAEDRLAEEDSMGADNTDQDTDFSNSLYQKLQENSALAEEEDRLFKAYTDFTEAVTQCAKNAALEPPLFSLIIDDLIPRFSPNRTGKIIGDDILKAWESLLLAQPDRLSSLQENASDEQILNFAEKTTDKYLQLALISYVETLIEIESCEIAYNMRRAKYKKHQIEKKIYEEHQRRREKIKKYIEAIRQQNFPVDAEMLVNNFFRSYRKDPDSASKMLENNPATFAPIQVDKIPPHFFGLIKAKPEDGFKVNKKLGKFLKNLKA